MEYRDADDDTCHELKRICSEMITVAPTKVHRQYQRSFSYASQCFTVSKFNLGVILSSSIATMDTAHNTDVIVDHHLTMSIHVSSVQHFASCASYITSCDRCQLMRPRQVVVELVAYCNLSSIRHFRHRAPVLTGCTECCSTVGHWHPKV